MAYNHLNTPTKCDIKPCQMCHFIKLNWFIKTRWWRCRSLSVVTINYSKSSEHGIHTGIRAGTQLIISHSNTQTNPWPAQQLVGWSTVLVTWGVTMHSFINVMLMLRVLIYLQFIIRITPPPSPFSRSIYCLCFGTSIQNTQQCLLYFQKS